MGFVREIFENYRPVPAELAKCGFKCENGVWTGCADLLFGKFRAELRIAPDRPPAVAVFDADGVEYTMIHVDSADGVYVSRVRTACAAWLTGIRERAFERERFFSERARRLAAALRDKFGDRPDDPWNGKYPGIGVFRRPENRKWYALVMNVAGSAVGSPEPRTDVLTLRAGKERSRELVAAGTAQPAYHMNRAGWVTFRLDSAVADEVILAELAAARELAASGGGAFGQGVWILPANPKFYDVVAAFAAEETILWKQSTRVRPGDRVYLYVGAPYSAILYRCRVEEADIPYCYEDENVRMTRVMKIRRLGVYDGKAFPFPVLRKYGVNAVRGPVRCPEALNAALEAAASDPE